MSVVGVVGAVVGGCSGEFTPTPTLRKTGYPSHPLQPTTEERGRIPYDAHAQDTRSGVRGLSPLAVVGRSG